jgi:hypothetical protein
MNLRQASKFLIAAVMLAGGTVSVDAARDPLPRSGTDRVTILRTSELRSAYLVRSGQVQYDASDMSAAGLRRQLQRHFDTVVALLLLNTPQNIELALDRLEADQHNSWSAEERGAWRERLLANRRTHITRLIEYRRRGQFPLNEGHAAQPAPIFVDNHDTACAVGHLMRLSGREHDVAGIQHESNLVYLPDVTAGPVVVWTLTSGITLEEAALIQPAYGPVLLPKPEHAIEVLSDEASFEFENLRYSNFRIFAGDNPAAPSVNIPVIHQACSWFGCGPTYPVILDVDLVLDVTQFPDVDLSVRNAPPHALEQSPPLLTSFPRMVVQFDVEVTAPNLRIAHLPNGGSLLSNSYFDGSQFRLFVNDSRDRLWIDQLRNPAPECGDMFCGRLGLDTPLQEIRLEDIGHPYPLDADIQPANRMTVVTEMYFPPDQDFRGQFINFSLIAVPEPTTATFAVMAIGLCAAAWPRKQIG